MKKILVLLTLLVVSQVKGQDKNTLHIGDPAPPLKYAKWLKGTPITSLNDSSMYVLEFWATWCGPCIAAMPHLSKLAKKYEKQATFIGVNVWEKTGDKPHESSLPTVTKFVSSSGDRMTYNVIADNNAQDMSKNWLEKAGVNSIPSTFIIYKGTIAWIGHPINLDEVIGPILAGTFDMAAFSKKYDVKAESSAKLKNDIKEISQAIHQAVAAKQFDKAFQLIDEAIQKAPIFKMSYKAEKFKILLNNFSETEALNYAKELNKENQNFLTINAVAIIEKEGLSKEAYLFAADNIRQVKPTRSLFLDRMALALRKGGKLQDAIAVQQQAVDLAKEEINNPKYAGRVFDYTITDYEAKVEAYKQALRKK